MTAEPFDSLTTHEKLKAIHQDQLTLFEQVRRVAEKLDKHLQAERRAKAAFSATYNSNVGDSEK